MGLYSDPFSDLLAKCFQWPVDPAAVYLGWFGSSHGLWLDHGGQWSDRTTMGQCLQVVHSLVAGFSVFLYLLHILVGAIWPHRGWISFITGI